MISNWAKTISYQSVINEIVLRYFKHQQRTYTIFYKCNRQKDEK